MKELITDSGNTGIFWVEVAKDATDIKILGKNTNYCMAGDLVYKTNENVWGQGDYVLPEGKWRYVGFITKNEIEIRGEILVDEDDQGFFKEYNNVTWALYPHEYPNDSLRSLLEYNKIFFEDKPDVTEKNVVNKIAIIKKVN